jgi:DNA-binding CsgD family transcriptional regulator
VKSNAETERRIARAVQLKAEGKTYAEIAKELGIRSRGVVNYYLNAEARRRQQRVKYLERVAEKRAYMRAYRAARDDAAAVCGDRTAFKPESPRQAALWAKLLGARP